MSSPSTMQTRSDSPCFVLQPTPAADVFIPNHYENHGLNLPLNSMPNERSFASTAPEPNLLSRETNKSSSSDQSCSSTDSDKSNSSAHGSMTFPVNGKIKKWFKDNCTFLYGFATTDRQPILALMLAVSWFAVSLRRSAGLWSVCGGQLTSKSSFLVFVFELQWLKS